MKKSVTSENLEYLLTNRKLKRRLIKLSTAILFSIGIVQRALTSVVSKKVRLYPKIFLKKLVARHSLILLLGIILRKQIIFSLSSIK